METGLEPDPTRIEAPSPDVIREHLNRILQSQLFSRSPRLRHFLKWGVEAALNGQTQVSEYATGIKVFERAVDFDPRLDPIVRVQARRLRSKLAEYYRYEGAKDLVEMILPMRAYIPTFQIRVPQPDTLAESAHGVALIPIISLSTDDEDRYFAEGLTREIAHTFSKAELSNFSVCIVRSHEWPLDLRKLMKGRDVHAALTGTVRKADGMLRISAELIRVPDGVVLWSEMFVVKGAQSISEQQGIARDIFRMVAESRPRWRRANKQPIGRNLREPHINGVYRLCQFSRSSLEKCVQRLGRALASNPTSGPVHAALAEAWVLLSLYGDYSPIEVMPKAKREAERALECGNLAGGYFAMALVTALYEWNWGKAESLFVRGIEIDPRLSCAREWLAAACLAPTGRIEEALDQLRLAQESEPLSVTIPNHLAYVMVATGRSDLAVNHLKECVALERNSALTNWTLGIGLLCGEQLNHAILAFERARELSEGASYAEASLAHAYAVAGRTEDGIRVLEQLRRKSKDKHISPLELALVHLGFGNHDAVFKCLAKARKERAAGLFRLHLDPRMKSLRQDARFASLIRDLSPKFQVPEQQRSLAKPGG